MCNSTFGFGAIKSDDIAISQTFLDAILFHLNFFLILVTWKKKTFVTLFSSFPPTTNLVKGLLKACKRLWMIKLFLSGKEKCNHFLSIGEREDNILLFSREGKNSNKETNMGRAQAFFDP